MPKKSQRKNRTRRPQAKSLSVVPNAYVTKMCYPALLVLNESAAGGGTFNTFAINDLYDPDYSSTGVQPIGYDQLAQMYSRMRVMEAAMELEFMTRGATVCQAGWFAHTAATPTSSVQAWSGQRYSASKLIQGSSGGPSSATFTAVFRPWELLSLTKKQYVDESDYSQVVGAGPVRRVFVSPFIIGSGAVGTAVVRVRWTFKVELSDPVSLGMS